ncbi:hypothetical protein DV451_003703 [Geotrichum candidum]|uniref:Uncharacterized protein n=1 Tax=Geotrichum candidum TaxID=1173061 RepID=A0A0J9XES6_GEOCN|nr:hypothetical protein DV451_003703 [Geotrichum candidum]KAI9210433.1 hypothetical protein DS838_004686 [Geotrichum bryndzae]KAF5107508.1 hypothetical protein DV453_003038 [Geotrichum candidum]KAF5117492.1 hypothetical protein DV495_005005 [Geotrichum candidum]KAF5118462.1 hypothetical protein DV454_000509 [Geotrichum candidum]
MGLFSKKDKNDDSTGGSHGRKLSSYDVQDPVLTAIRDEEPFQMSANSGRVNQESTISPDMQSRDVFGNPIGQPDRSNPSRPGNERPLDTIRAFEYACTGDERLRDQMETSRYGWATRPNFVPRFDTNPYAAVSPTQNAYTPTAGAEGDGAFQTYVPPKPEKKQKRGLFGRKKK